MKLRTKPMTTSDLLANVIMVFIGLIVIGGIIVGLVGAARAVNNYEEETTENCLEESKGCEKYLCHNNLRYGKEKYLDCTIEEEKGNEEICGV